MFGEIAAFELRYQLRNPVFWVVGILFFLLTFGAMTIPQIQIGSGGNIHKNAPVAIANIHVAMSLFFMFVTTAFVANVIVRDDESGFGPMVRSTRVRRFDYLFARFLGAFGAGALAFLVVPFAIWCGSYMPWLDPETLGPNRWADYAYAFFLIALPNLFLTAAIFFAVATVTRSMTYSYVGVVVFLVLYSIVGALVGSKPELRELGGYVEPFGGGAFDNLTRYWTSSESNAGMPPFGGSLLANRLIWLGVGAAALVFAYGRFSFAERPASRRVIRRQERRAAKLAGVAPALVDRLPALHPASAGRARLWTRTRFEIVQVFRSPAYLVILLVGLFLTVSNLLVAGEVYGTLPHPRTFLILTTLIGGFGIVPLVVAIYYSGELVWRDRDRRMHEIVDATSLPSWAYLVPKVLAIVAVLFTSFVVSMIAAIVVQLYRGEADLHLDQYVGWYLVPLTISMTCLAVLAVFVQALSPSKYVGWGILVLYLVSTVTLSNMGFEHPLYRYNSSGLPAFSDMNGARVGGPTGWWLRLYWSAWAVVLAVLAHLLWRRGTGTPLAVRLARVPARLQGPAGAIIATALLIAAGTGGWLFYNMNILNTYRNSEANERRLANYEKKYLKYEGIATPSITDIALDVDLHPSERRMTTSGRYRYVNDTGAPLSVLHLRLTNPETELVSVDVPGARLVSNDTEFKYRIYRFPTPLAPGEVGTLSFRSERRVKGLRANGDDTRLVDNSTFLNNSEIAPIFGMGRSGMLTERAKRRKYGLPPELRVAKLEDRSATRRNYIANADWVNSDITVSTDADQTPIAPGVKVSDAIRGGRRIARFRSDAPILAFFSIQSAAYAQKSADADGVRATVFYDPQHGYNVDRMLDATRISLRYYRTAFGPYQFPYARIVEFPGYQTFAQAFAGTIPYSEKIGFVADVRDPDKIDYVTYVTAHELGHQYWAHQMISADMQGGTLLVETMAQYSALMVMKHLYGEDKIRRFLKYELDGYLRGRGTEALEELPLDRVENQQYIHYRKGAVVMYLLQDRLGEDRVNAMLRALLARYRFKDAPFARSTDLVDGLMALARNPQERLLVSDLMQRITVYDLKARNATTRRLGDGTWETRFTADAGKFYADGKGRETKATLSDTIEVGAFARRPGIGAFAATDVLLRERRPIVGGQQLVRLVTRAKPAFVGVDPYNKYIDRNSDDNVVAVGS